MKRLIPLILALFAWGALVAACKDPGVTPKNIDTATTVGEYELLLADCRKQGKAAKSYEVYEACAEAVDAKLCAAKHVRCTDGGSK